MWYYGDYCTCTHLCTTVTPVYYCKLLYTPVYNVHSSRMDSTFRANEVFIPVVFLEAGASETLVCSRAKRAQSELEALIAPRRVEGSQRNFLDSLPTLYSVNHLTEKHVNTRHQKKLKHQRMCVRGVDERPPNHPLQGYVPSLESGYPYTTPSWG